MDLITILIPTYNRADTFLPQAVMSAMSQTHKDLEIIIGDNASTDGTEELVREMQKQDKRIRYYRAEKNTGTPYTFHNWGIENAEGETIAFLDDDSVYEPDHIELLRKKMLEGKYDVVYGFATDVFVGKDMHVIKTFIRGKPFEPNAYIMGTAHLNYIDTSDIMADRQLLLDVDGMNEQKTYQDWALMVKLAFRTNFKVGWVEKSLTNHINHKWASDFSPTSIDDREKKFYVF